MHGNCCCTFLKKSSWILGFPFSVFCKLCEWNKWVWKFLVLVNQTLWWSASWNNSQNINLAPCLYLQNKLPYTLFLTNSESKKHITTGLSVKSWIDTNFPGQFLRFIFPSRSMFSVMRRACLWIMFCCPDPQPYNMNSLVQTSVGWSLWDEWGASFLFGPDENYN